MTLSKEEKYTGYEGTKKAWQAEISLTDWSIFWPRHIIKYKKICIHSITSTAIVTLKIWNKMQIRH